MKTPEPTQSIHRIRHTSRRFIRIFQALLILVPLIDTAVWLFLNDLPPHLLHSMLPGYLRLPLPPLARALGFCISLIPMAVFVFADTVLIRLFRLYAEGEFFESGNVRCYRSLSRALMAWCLAGILTDPLFSLALTLHHPAGEHLLSVGLGSLDLTALLTGGILAVITRVMDEARKMKAEQDFTI